MPRVTQLRVKGSDGTFPNSYPIGAEAINIYFNNGNNLEDEVEKIEDEIEKVEEEIASEVEKIEEEIATKAPIYHASNTTDYGLGSNIEYGHLKISDEYTNDETNDSDNTALSITGILDLFNRYLQIFQVLNNVGEAGQMLYSSYNTAYQKQLEEEDFTEEEITINYETLFLIPQFFDVEDNETNHQTLIINIKKID